VPELPHSDALGAQQAHCTPISHVTVRYKTYKKQKEAVSESFSELVTQLGFCS